MDNDNNNKKKNMGYWLQNIEIILFAQEIIWNNHIPYYLVWGMNEF